MSVARRAMSMSFLSFIRHSNKYSIRQTAYCCSPASGTLPVGSFSSNKKYHFPLREMSSDTGKGDNLIVAHDAKHKKFFIKLGEDEAKLEYAEEKQKNGDVVLNMWHTEVPPQLHGRGIAKILAKEAFDYVVSNNLKMHLSCSYLQKYLSDNPSDKYKAATV